MALVAFSDVTLFPNPTSGYLELQVDEQLSIHDLSTRFYSPVGQLLATFEGQTTFDVSHLAKGVYVAEVVSKGKIIGREKIVVAR